MHTPLRDVYTTQLPAGGISLSERSSLCFGARKLMLAVWIQRAEDAVCAHHSEVCTHLPRCRFLLHGLLHARMWHHTTVQENDFRIPHRNTTP